MMCQKVFVVGIFIASEKLWEKLGICIYAPISTYLHNVALMWKVHHFNLGLCGDWLEPSSSGHVRKYSFWHFHIGFIFQPRRFLLEKTTSVMSSPKLSQKMGGTPFSGGPQPPLWPCPCLWGAQQNLSKKAWLLGNNIFYFFSSFIHYLENKTHWINTNLESDRFFAGFFTATRGFSYGALSGLAEGFTSRNPP